LRIGSEKIWCHVKSGQKFMAFHRLDNRDWTPKGAGAAWPLPSSIN
jgi:hypothetical protein